MINQRDEIILGIILAKMINWQDIGGGGACCSDGMQVHSISGVSDETTTKRHHQHHCQADQYDKIILGAGERV